MWPRKALMRRMQPMQRTGRSIQGIEGYGGGRLWRRSSALSCSANEEEEEEENELNRDLTVDCESPNL